MTLLYKELTGVLRGCIYDVHNALGPGYDEETYHQGLIWRLKKEKVPFRSKEKRFVKHRGLAIKGFELDLIAYDKIILELKCIQSDFLQPNYVQIISQLKLWQKKLGLLINFGLQKVKIKRIPFTEKQKNIVENYDYFKHRITPEDKEQLIRLRNAILNIYEMHNLGYGETVYLELLKAELDYQNIRYKTETPLNVEFEGDLIRTYKLNFPVVENRFVCGVTAIKEKVDFYDIARIQTYLKALDLHFGLLINFGKKQLEIRGICA